MDPDLSMKGRCAIRYAPRPIRDGHWWWVGILYPQMNLWAISVPSLAGWVLGGVKGIYFLNEFVSQRHLVPIGTDSNAGCLKAIA